MAKYCYSSQSSSVVVEYIADDPSNPFNMQPSCEQFVPGYGATTADFHVIGDHPGTHGGLETGIPFTATEWSEKFFDALVAGGIVESVDLETGQIDAPATFFSYLHLCVPESGGPSADSYSDLEPFFDAELRAITAHVLLPVGSRATEHVLREFTARDASLAADMDSLHGTELRGSGWLVIPIKDPAEWGDGDTETLVGTLQSLLHSDYRQISDLGRFEAGADPYYVR